MVIDFTPEQEHALGVVARRQGITPELLVRSVVEPLLAQAKGEAEVAEQGSFADRLSYYIGAIDSAEHVPEQPRRAGTEYGRLLLRRHREGYP